MTLPRYKAGPVEYWIGEAITQFINGAIRGSLGGAALGGVGGGATAVTPVGNSMTADQKIWVTIALFLAMMVANGWKTVVVWHDTNPFPNPWPKPTGNTQPPFQPPP